MHPRWFKSADVRGLRVYLVNFSAQLGIQNHYIDGIPALYEAADLLHQPKLTNFENPSPRVALGE
jgi:hypothetical protein